MVANSRTSEGSKSAGTESQSEASKESGGDLSERCVNALAVYVTVYINVFILNWFCFVVVIVVVFPRVEALQLGDCGQEVALISRLAEGSKIFLSREESQSFIKE